MLWSLIVPELILGWAFRQWIAAGEIEKEYKKGEVYIFSVRYHVLINPDYGWTKLHGHFLIMGGFSLVNQSSSSVVEIPGADIPKISEFPKEGAQDYRTAMEKLLEDIEAYKCYTALMLERHKHGAEKGSCDRDLSKGDLEHYRNYELGWQLRANISYLRESPGALSFRRFKDLFDDSRIAFPSITAAEICDKSKGDFLSKTIAILQTTWFIVQCLARHHQKLAVTELELITLALASLNGFIYGFWWHKPLGVHVPVPVYLKGSEPVAGRIHHHEQSLVATFFGKDFEEFIKSITFGEYLNTLHLQIASSITSFLQARREETHTYSSSRLLFLWFFGHPFRWFLYIPISTVFKSLYAIINTDTMGPGATHVPTFYATCFDWHTDMILTYFVLPFIAVVFGVLHCLGWNLFFPTKAEQFIWRSASVFITFIPIIVLPFWKYKSRVAMYPALALLSLYVFARFALLMEAVVTLRKQPETAYLAVDWSYFLTHIS